MQWIKFFYKKNQILTFKKAIFDGMSISNKEEANTTKKKTKNEKMLKSNAENIVKI